MKSRLFFVLIVAIFIIYACNPSKITKYRLEDINKEVSKENIDTLMYFVSAYPIEKINNDLVDRLLKKVPYNDSNLSFYISIGKRIQRKEIFDYLCYHQELLILDYSKNKIHKSMDEFQLLCTIFTQKCDSMDRVFLRWFNFWNNNFVKLASENGKQKTDSEIEKYWDCGEKVYFTALFLNRLGNKEFTDVKLDSLEKKTFRYGKESIKFENLIPDTTSQGIVKKVELPVGIDAIENIDLSQTPIIKDFYYRNSYRTDFKAKIISYHKKALIEMYADLGYVLYYAEMIDNKSIKIQFLDQQDIWELF